MVKVVFAGFRWAKCIYEHVVPTLYISFYNFCITLPEHQVMLVLALFSIHLAANEMIWHTNPKPITLTVRESDRIPTETNNSHRSRNQQEMPFAVGTENPCSPAVLSRGPQSTS